MKLAAPVPVVPHGVFLRRACHNFHEEKRSSQSATLGETQSAKKQRRQQQIKERNPTTPPHKEQPSGTT
jgi:hypothetical protein